MLQGGEDNYFNSGGPSNCCPRCGAGMHNSYKHDEDCLINVPVRNMKSWMMGWRMKHNGSTFGVPSSRTPATDAFRMGVRCATKKIDAERTIKSLGEAVEIAKAMHT